MNDLKCSAVVLAPKHCVGLATHAFYRHHKKSAGGRQWEWQGGKARMGTGRRERTVGTGRREGTAGGQGARGKGGDKGGLGPPGIREVGRGRHDMNEMAGRHKAEQESGNWEEDDEK